MSEPMIRCRRKLEASAMLRFPDDPAARAAYIGDVLAVSIVHDADTYTIAPEVFEALKRHVRAKHGPRPRVAAVPRSAPGRFAQALNVARAAAGGAASIAKTSLGIDRVSDAECARRLAVCRDCPGNFAHFTVNGHTIHPQHAEHRARIVEAGGKLHTCGPMLASMRQAGGATCGCVLSRKARDAKQECPNGWW